MTISLLDNQKSATVSQNRALIAGVALAITALACGLITAFVHLPSGWHSVGTIGSPIIGGGALIAFACAVGYYRRSSRLNLEIQQLKGPIPISSPISNPVTLSKGPATTISHSRATQTQRTPPVVPGEASLIINNIYIGDAQAFLHVTTGLQGFMMLKNYQVQGSASLSNPLQFGTVITVCPLAAIYDGMANPYLIEEHYSKDSQASFRTALKDVTWHQIGEDVGDDANDLDNCWIALVEKATGTKESDVQRWFERTFQVLDQAIKDNKKVLIHCQAGQSRSVSLFAAYLINRHGMTAEEAVELIRKQRPCIKPKFTDQLKAYENALKLEKSAPKK